MLFLASKQNRAAWDCELSRRLTVHWMQDMLLKKGVLASLGALLRDADEAENAISLTGYEHNVA